MKYSLPAVLLLLGGCANSTAINLNARSLFTDTAGYAGNCTDIIATNGGMVKFCQTRRTVDIYEIAVADPDMGAQPSLIDDPKVLSTLQDRLILRPSTRNLVNSLLDRVLWVTGAT